MGSSLEDAVGFHFKSPELLKAALTHKSFSAERKASRCNERLEFLGDSILSAVVAHRLYELYPNEDEGSLSKRKAILVARPALAQWATELNLGGHLYLSASEESSGGRLRPSILCNALEALIGAIYLDGGYAAASVFIERRLAQSRETVEGSDFKSRLQEVLQKRFKAPPVYEIARTAGPEHDKTFTVAVRMGKQVLGSGSGKSKKEAEQAAAKDALAAWNSKGKG